MHGLLATRKRVSFSAFLIATCTYAGHNPSGFASLTHLPLHKGGFGTVQAFAEKKTEGLFAFLFIA